MVGVAVGDVVGVAVVLVGAIVALLLVGVVEVVVPRAKRKNISHCILCEIISCCH